MSDEGFLRKLLREHGEAERQALRKLRNTETPRSTETSRESPKERQGPANIEELKSIWTDAIVKNLNSFIAETVGHPRAMLETVRRDGWEGFGEVQEPIFYSVDFDPDVSCASDSAMSGYPSFNKTISRNTPIRTTELFARLCCPYSAIEVQCKSELHTSCSTFRYKGVISPSQAEREYSEQQFHLFAIPHKKVNGTLETGIDLGARYDPQMGIRLFVASYFGYAGARLPHQRVVMRGKFNYMGRHDDCYDFYERSELATKQIESVLFKDTVQRMEDDLLPSRIAYIAQAYADQIDVRRRRGWKVEYYHYNPPPTYDTGGFVEEACD
ncbi:hypothetical protein ACIBQ1_09240 [Nonomuraea sp. NPDC050153]|uniref:hypothetical protein n=1 Tax=Nonomuraea sp. NPDC050153 TaxID=3364359 RepID=UPI0037ACC93F